MRHARKPAIFNFERHKNTTRLKHSEDFRESSILRVAQSQMMQHQNSDRSTKCLRFERQNGSIALDYACGINPSVQPHAEIMAVFEAGHTSRASRQFRRGRTRTGSDFQDMLSKIRSLKRPWQPPAFREVPPQSRSTEPVFKTIHNLSDGANGAASSQHSVKSRQSARHYRTAPRGFSYNYPSPCPRYQTRYQAHPPHKSRNPTHPLLQRRAPAPRVPFGK